MYYVDSKLASELNSFLLKYVNETEQTKLLKYELDVILIEMLNLVSYESEPIPPNYSEATISSTFQHIAKIWNVEPQKMIFPGR